jgi:hypothetical protein
MIGKGVLLECLESKSVESVLVINRKTCIMQHPKLKEIIHNDFYNFDSLSDKMSGFNACFFCLGVSSARLSEQEYYKVTYDLTLNFARSLLKASPEITFCYVSGAGTDSSMKSKMMWARVKGKTENDLLAMPFKGAYMFRPGFIQPMKGIRSRTGIYNFLYFFFKPFYFILKSFRNFVTNTESMGKAMIYIARDGYAKNILECSDINILAENKE